MPLRPNSVWIPTYAADSTADDSDKIIFTVPANTVYRVLTVYIKLVTTATVGNRQLVLEFRDDSDNIYSDVRPSIVQAASLTRYYNFGLSFPDTASFRDTDVCYCPIPLMDLPAGWDLRVYDNNAVDAAADDMTVRCNIDQRYSDR